MKTFSISNYERSGASTLAVAISNEADIPATFTGVRELSLSPTSELLDEYHTGKLDNELYAERYVALLGDRGLTAESIASQFEDGTIFVCYDYEDGVKDEEDEDGDAKGFICHRFILADWLRASGAALVTEV